jgi:hypothetical protein
MTNLMQQLMAVAHAGGWTFRPVILPFQATERGTRLLHMLTPPPLRNATPTRIWGILYPLSYLLAFVWLFAIGGAEMQTTRSILLLVWITVAWWGTWGFITWLLCGAPRFWRRHE